MANFLGPDATSGQVTAIHAGLNHRVFTYVLTETASASALISIGRLPIGARVVDCNLIVSGAVNTSGSQVNVKDNNGNTYIRSASASEFITRYDPDYTSHWNQITSSCNVQIGLYGFPAATGTTTMQFKLSVSYLADSDTP